MYGIYNGLSDGQSEISISPSLFLVITETIDVHMIVDLFLVVMHCQAQSLKFKHYKPTVWSATYIVLPSLTNNVFWPLQLSRSFCLIYRHHQALLSLIRTGVEPRNYPCIYHFSSVWFYIMLNKSRVLEPPPTPPKILTQFIFMSSLNICVPM